MLRAVASMSMRALHIQSGAGEGNSVGDEEVVRWVGALGRRRPRCRRAEYEQYPRVVRGVSTFLGISRIAGGSPPWAENHLSVWSFITAVPDTKLRTGEGG